MVRVSVRRDARGRICELRARGHGRFDPEGGVDLVCAAVSALLGALALGLTEVLGLPARPEAGEGRFHLRLPPGQREPAQVLLETTVRALQELEANYRGSLRLTWLKQAEKAAPVRK